MIVFLYHYFRRPSGKGKRLIVLHAGSENGWVSKAELVFESKKSTGDYHNEMNSERYCIMCSRKLMELFDIDLRNGFVMLCFLTSYPVH